MHPSEVIRMFLGDGGKEDARAYLEAEGIFECLEMIERSEDDRIRPDYVDLARLHCTLRKRKPFTVLEFGVGYSTLVIADAIHKNREFWDALPTRTPIRCSTPFELHSVDASDEWIRRTQKILPVSVSRYVRLHRSGVRVDIFCGRACHLYERLPDIVPDFIYLDGPSPGDVSGHINGSSWKNPDRVVMAADILVMEPFLLPGTMILVDGRTSNARFLEAHLYGHWEVAWTPSADVSAFELQQPPVGQINRDRLTYCLGSRTENWQTLFGRRPNDVSR
jgi:hypothetical protein